MSVVIKLDSPNVANTCALFKLDEIREVLTTHADSAENQPASAAPALPPKPTDALPSLDPIEVDRGIRTGIDQEMEHQTSDTAVEDAFKDAVKNVVKKTVDELVRMEQQRHAESDQRVLQLAVAIAQRIIRRELQQQPSISLQWIRESLELVVGSRRLRICLHPDDHLMLAEQVERIAAEVARFAKLDITSDPTVSQGGCRVESEHGLVDQCVEAQLQRIVQELDCHPDAEF